MRITALVLFTMVEMLVGSSVTHAEEARRIILNNGKSIYGAKIERETADTVVVLVQYGVSLNEKEEAIPTANINRIVYPRYSISYIVAATFFAYCLATS